jgi:hypothetical protein
MARLTLSREPPIIRAQILHRKTRTDQARDISSRTCMTRTPKRDAPGRSGGPDVACLIAVGG